MKFRALEYTLAVSLAAVAFIFYLLTICPSIGIIDAGELATVCSTLGIAHPTGYPLFTLIGRIFARLPLSMRTISKLNLMSAFECSIAVFFLFRFLVFFLSDFSIKKFQQKGGQLKKEIVSEDANPIVFLPASCGTVALAFSETFWSEALSIEVYPLHVVFLSVLLLLFSKAISLDTQSSVGKESRQVHRAYWFGFAYVLGLSFANHMTTILLAPAFLYCYFYVNGFSSVSWKKILRLTPLFLAGLSVYIYFPVRAGVHPLLSWGNVTTPEKLLWHISGKQYRVWMFSSTDVAAKQFAYFTDTVLPEFGYIPLLFALIGLWKLLNVSRAKFLFTFLLFLGCVLYSINYDIHDIDSYFLLAYLTVAMWIAIGVSYSVQFFKSRNVSKIISGLAIIVCMSPLYYNYSIVDRSKDFMVEDYTKNVFASLEPNAVIISYQWDYFVSAAYYLQLVEHQRPDVIVIDKELMRRSWYYLQLETRYPDLIHKVKPELDAFLRELYKFEYDIPYNANTVEYRYSTLIRSIIDTCIKSRPVYVTHEIEPQYTAKYNRVPSGLAFQLFSDSLFHDIQAPDFLYNRIDHNDRYSQQLTSLYARAYTNKAIYLKFFDKNDQSRLFLEKALQIDSSFPEALALKSHF